MVSDGKKSATKSGRAWVIVDEWGLAILTCMNHDIENVPKIHSHRSEIFGLLSALLFIDEYCRYYGL